MPEQNQTKPNDLGMYRRNEPPKPSRASRADMIAVALSAVWIIALGAFFLVTNRSDAPALDSLQFVMTLLAIFLPVALIWVATQAAKSTKIMREESARLQTAIDAMRQTYVQSQQVQHTGVRPSVERKLEEIAAAQRKTESAIAMFTSIRPEPNAPAVAQSALPQTAEAEEQGKLELGTSAEEMSTPINIADFIRALNFPENAEDKEGFRALRRALEDRQTAQLVQASQDVLTMLSHDGIYMDDLRPDRARPEIWRQFAKGERGRTIAGLGGIRDRSCLALTAGRMKQDPVFRDAAHHFLRRFDTTFAGFEAMANDADIAELSDTRTARAFMLLGRVTGTFN